MNFVIEQLSLLGLNGREVRVFTTLSTFGQMKMTLIAARSGLARTTVDALVRRLLKQGLIVRIRVAGHYEYHVDLEDVTNKLAGLYSKLHPTTSKSTHSELVPAQCSTKAYALENDDNIDINNTWGGLRELFKVHTGERIKVLLGHNQEGEGAAAERLLSYVVRASEAMIKLEVLVCRDVANIVHARANGEVANQQIGEVYLNIVPSSYCDSYTDLVVCTDVVRVIDLLRGNVFEDLHTMNTVASVRHLLTIASEAGWSVEMAAWAGDR